MLRNRADAEDVASETFLAAVERLGDLRDPGALKGWLYAIARNAALRIIEGRKRATPVDDYAEDATAYASAALPVPDEGAEFAEMRSLFDAAASTLSEKERTVYELAVRHNMSSAEIAKVLDVRPAYAYILVNRLKSSVTEAAEAVALARVGTEKCPELAQVLQGVDPVSSRGRKAVARHARTCETCMDTKQRRASLPVMMQGVAYAEPGSHFRRALREQIDAKWSGAAGAGAAAATGASVLVGSIVAIVVVSGALIAGAAQRTLTHHEVGHRPPPVKTLTATTPKPTASPDEPSGDAGGPAVGPQSTSQPSGGGTPQVVIVNGGNTGDVTSGTTSSSNGSSSGSQNPGPPCCEVSHPSGGGGGNGGNGGGNSPPPVG